MERQAHIVQPAEAVPAFARGRRRGKTHRLFLGHQSAVQIQAADVEGQLRPQHLEEAQDVIGGLGERNRNPTDPPVSHVRQDLRSGLVAIGDMEGVGRGPFAKHPLEPVRLLLVGLAQRVVGAFVALAQFCAQQDAFAELQFRQMTLDTGQVLIAQLLSRASRTAR